MRLWDNAVNKEQQNKAMELYAKLAEVTPSDKLTMDDINALQFILRQYKIELACIVSARKREAKRMETKMRPEWSLLMYKEGEDEIVLRKSRVKIYAVVYKNPDNGRSYFDLNGSMVEVTRGIDKYITVGNY